MKLAPQFHLSQVEQVAVRNQFAEGRLNLNYGLLEVPLSARRDDECITAFSKITNVTCFG